MTDSAQPSLTPSGTGAILAGRYRLQARIGRGGMADVFRADDNVLSRPVAVKVFRFDTAAGDDRRRVDAEVRTLASLRHPGLVTVFDAGTADEPNGDGTPFLVMELITGPTLSQRLSEGPLPPEETAHLGAELAATLGYVHASGVVHRDVKPANILLDTPSNGTAGFSAKLTDFGIARLIDSTRLTMHGMTVGTANYLSPEQAQTGAVTPASDVYSLGLVLIECLTGHLAYPGIGVEAAIARLQRPPAIPAEFGPDWTQLLTAMTDRAPEARPSTEGVSRTLNQIAADSPVPGGETARSTPTRATTVLSEHDLALRSAGSTTILTRPPRGARSLPHRVYLAAAAGLVVLVVVVVALSSRSTGNSGKPAPIPSYPSVSGQLGSHLQQLERTLP
ncbi:MAG TPA: serine/threonine-protein kinase [Jatrophihabitans sp.]